MLSVNLIFRIICSQLLSTLLLFLTMSKLSSRWHLPLTSTKAHHVPKDRACNRFLLKQPILQSICAGNVLKESANRNESTPLRVHFAVRANMFLSMFRQLWVFHPWRRTNVYSKVSSKKSTKECRSFASIMTGTLKWSIIYCLTNPNESNNNTGNKDDIQDLLFLCKSRRAGTVATLRYRTNTCSRRTLPHAPLCSCTPSFHFTSEDAVSLTE